MAVPGIGWIELWSEYGHKGGLILGVRQVKIDTNMLSYVLHGFSRGHSMQEVACETNAVKVKKALFILCCHVKTGSLLKKHW